MCIHAINAYFKGGKREREWKTHEKMEDLNSTATVFESFSDLLIEGFYEIIRVSKDELVELDS